MKAADITPGRVYLDGPNDRWLVAVDARELCATFVDAATLVYCGYGDSACDALVEVSYGAHRDQVLAKVVAHLWRPAVASQSADAVPVIANALLGLLADAERDVAQAFALCKAATAAITIIAPATQHASVQAIADHSKAIGVYEGIARAAKVVQPHLVPKPQAARGAA